MPLDLLLTQDQGAFIADNGFILTFLMDIGILCIKCLYAGAQSGKTHNAIQGHLRRRKHHPVSHRRHRPCIRHFIFVRIPF